MEQPKYFYVVTIRMVNPVGGCERVASASGVFWAPADASEEVKLKRTLAEASGQLGLGAFDPASPCPDVNRYSILFYLCTEDTKPGGK